MAYLFYMDGVALPVAPPSMTIQTPGKNETIELIDGTEINILKAPGLKAISFTMPIPQTEYPWATYGAEGYKDAQYYIDILEKLKTSKTTFQFIVMRFKGKGRVIRSAMDMDAIGATLNDLFTTNLKVSLEDFQVNEDAGNGYDLEVTINLKEYVEYSAREIIKMEDPETGDETVVVEDPPRPVDPEPVATIPDGPLAGQPYTVIEGDCLWDICATQLGAPGKCWDVAALNGIADPDLIYPGQVISLAV